MKVFISWSGERSKALAHALKEWLPEVLHFVEPWVSDTDIEAGGRWAEEVGKELEASNFGIVCVTPENIESQWMLFESGALAKSMQESRVIPLLFGLDVSALSGPLAQFQAKKVAGDGLSDIIQSLNRATKDNGWTEERCSKQFRAFWPDLEKRLGAIPAEAPEERHRRPQHEIIEELVTSVRGLDSRMGELSGAVSSERRGPFGRRGRMRFSPRMFDELMGGARDPNAILMLAGFVREDMPWMYEILIDLHGDLKSGSTRKRSAAINRTRKSLHSMRHSPMMDMFADSAESHMMAMEIPMLLDHVLDELSRPAEAAEPDGDEEDASTE